MKLWHAISDNLTLTLSDMLSLTRSLWHTPSNNTRKLAWDLHCQSAVYITAYIHLLLVSICLIGRFESWSLNGGYSGIYRTTAMGFWYLNRVAVPSILIELSFLLHLSPSIASMSTMSFSSWSGLWALGSGTISLRLRMLLSFILPRLVSTIEHQSCHC